MRKILAALLITSGLIMANAAPAHGAVAEDLPTHVDDFGSRAAAATPGNSKPFPGNPHWWRPSGFEAVVQYRVDASAKALQPLLADAVNSWNNRSPGSPYMHLQLLPLGGDCSSSFCITVAEANNYSCGTAQTFLAWDQTSFGHLHGRAMLIAGNFDCGLTLMYAKFMMCHEVGHTQMVDHDPTGIRPCSPGDGLPVVNDVNVRNYLGATSG